MNLQPTGLKFGAILGGLCVVLVAVWIWFSSSGALRDASPAPVVNRVLELDGFGLVIENIGRQFQATAISVQFKNAVLTPKVCAQQPANSEQTAEEPINANGRCHLTRAESVKNSETGLAIQMLFADGSEAATNDRSGQACAQPDGDNPRFGPVQIAGAHEVGERGDHSHTRTQEASDQASVQDGSRTFGRGVLDHPERKAEAV